MERDVAHELVTLPQVNRRTGLGLRQLRRAVASGDLEIFDIGSWPRVRWADVLGWIERNRREPAARRQVRT